MKEKGLSELSDLELLEKRKKAKSANIATALIIGIMIGIAFYSTVRNGIGFLTFFPLLFMPIGATNNKSFKAVEAEVKSRNLK